ncbi:hypothetical protein [Curtobacterium sp. MCBD17_019]|uniref:hypothetical protein n=1 Tax=Curtobacterium sp. MCBD17_019 TaxID=2175669 RepID=UPI0015E8D808|nr:hypothetical protein [Curtobacterium sp. MCBD17_019]
MALLHAVPALRLGPRTTEGAGLLLEAPDEVFVDDAFVFAGLWPVHDPACSAEEDLHWGDVTALEEHREGDGLRGVAGLLGPGDVATRGSPMEAATARPLGAHGSVSTRSRAAACECRCSGAYGRLMKHVTYSDKSLLLGDTTADLLLEYAGALGTDGTADAVTVKAMSSDGDDVEATFLLGEGAPLMAETSTTTVPEPDNADADTYLREKIEALVHPAKATTLPEGDVYPDDYAEFQS